MSRNLIVAFFLVLLCSSCSILNHNDKQRAQLHLRIGSAHLKNGRYPAALAELLKAEKLDSTNPNIHNNLGLAYFVRKKFKLSAKHLRAAVKLEPNFTEARNNLGRVYIELEQYENAIRELKISIQDLTYSKPEKSLINLGLAYFKNSDFENSGTYFKRALEIKGNDCMAYNYYGRTLFEQKVFTEAAQSFDKAIRFCKKFNVDEPHFYSALSYMELGEKEKSLARIDELIELFPKSKFANKARDMKKLLQ